MDTLWKDKIKLQASLYVHESVATPNIKFCWAHGASNPAFGIRTFKEIANGIILPFAMLQDLASMGR